MLSLHMIENSSWLLQILVSAFLATLFLQSGIDKVVDRRGNVEFLQGHFAKSPLAGIVRLLVTLITILEVLAGVLSAIGCVVILATHNSVIAFYGAVVSAVSILALFFGQRMAKIMRGRRFLFLTFCFVSWRFTFWRNGCDSFGLRNSFVIPIHPCHPRDPAVRLPQWLDHEQALDC
jgi:uncharacterized membrane protein YphA (DoxX/SURF4 family)